jgi:hypothetical protein
LSTGKSSYRMSARTILVLLAVFQLMATRKSLAADATKLNEQRVRDYVVAYNKKDVDAMLVLVTDDIQWLSVAGDKITVETQGKAKLRESMAAYFKSSPSAKSELEWVEVTASRVAARERAHWQGKSGAKSQASLSVYEFRAGLISRVYYFPAEK